MLTKGMSNFSKNFINSKTPDIIIFVGVAVGIFAAAKCIKSLLEKDDITEDPLKETYDFLSDDKVSVEDKVDTLKKALSNDFTLDTKVEKIKAAINKYMPTIKLATAGIGCITFGTTLKNLQLRAIKKHLLNATRSNRLLVKAIDGMDTLTCNLFNSVESLVPTNDKIDNYSNGARATAETVMNMIKHTVKTCEDLYTPWLDHRIETYTR